MAPEYFAEAARIFTARRGKVALCPAIIKREAGRIAETGIGGGVTNENDIATALERTPQCRRVVRLRKRGCDRGRAENQAQKKNNPNMPSSFRLPFSAHRICPGL